MRSASLVCSSDSATVVKVVDPKDRGTNRPLSKRCAKPRTPSFRAPSAMAYQSTLIARFIVCSIFSQEKHIFFEQIKPTCVIWRPSVSFLSEGPDLFALLTPICKDSYKAKSRSMVCLLGNTLRACTRETSRWEVSAGTKTLGPAPQKEEKASPFVRQVLSSTSEFKLRNL